MNKQTNKQKDWMDKWDDEYEWMHDGMHQWIIIIEHEYTWICMKLWTNTRMDKGINDWV